MGLRFQTTIPHMPHPGSDYLEVVMRLGWAGAGLLGYSLCRAAVALGRDPYSLSLVGALCLGAIQKVWTIPAAGFLVWVIWLFWVNERTEDAKRQTA